MFRHNTGGANSSVDWLPTKWQQFLDATVHVGSQSGQHVLQTGPRVVAVQLCGLQETHDDPARQLVGMPHVNESPR